MTDAAEPSHRAEPPTAPDTPRHVRLYRAQWIGIPLLALVPLLALAGVLGEERARIETGGAGLAVAVDYPGRVRSGQRTHIDVSVRNESSAAARDVTVHFDPRYFQHSFDLLFIPSAAAPYAVELSTLLPGAQARVRVEFEAERPWRNGGSVAVSSNGRETVRARISTFILP